MNPDSVKALVFDLDGVIWLGNNFIPGVSHALAFLRSKNFQIRFFTNNASLHRSEYVTKLASMDIEANINEVLSSGYSATRYATRTFGKSKIHVMGSQGLKQELIEAGHTLVERGAQLVIVGYDRTFNWEKLDCAFQNVYEDKAKFIACNMDKRYVEKDSMRPGTGASVAALCYSLEAQPDIIAGKPHQPMIDALFDTLECEPHESILIGDKLYTDIACGRSAGMQTALVRSGQGAEEEQKITPETAPDFVIDSVADLPKMFS